jgi:hypothetical protein
MSRGRGRRRSASIPFVRLGPHVLIDPSRGARELDENVEEVLRLLFDPIDMHAKLRRGETDPVLIADAVASYFHVHVAYVESLVDAYAALRRVRASSDPRSLAELARALQKFVRFEPILDVVAKLHRVRASSDPRSLAEPVRTAARLAEELCKKLPDKSWLAAALAFEAGFGAGRLFEAEFQKRDILAGDLVHRGGWKGAARRREEAGAPPPEARAAAWREELAKLRRPDGGVPRGAISAAARRVAQRLGTTEEAERRFYYDRLFRRSA